jgi:signal transduction histidine kinase
MGLRHRSIRLRVILLVLIPVLSLIGVYAFAATITVNATVNLARAKSVETVTALPAGNLQTQLDVERSLALRYLANPTGPALTGLKLQEAKTSRAVKVFDGTNMSGSLTANASTSEKAAAAQLVKATGTLPQLRGQIATGSISKSEVLNQYSAIVTAGYRVLEDAIQQYSNVPLVTEALSLIKLDEVDQLALQESDLFTSDLAARSFPLADRVEFTQLAAVRQNLLADNLHQLNSADRATYDKYVSAQSATALTQLENTIVHAPAGHGLPSVQELPWVSAVTAYSTGLGKALTQAANATTARAQSQADATYLQFFLAGGLGLLAVILSLLFSLLIGRGLVRQLGELRESALALANDRLPSVMRRLRDGETVDVAAEAPQVESSADEIDQVRQAFNIAARTAIEAAVDEANLRRGVSDVFRNLARRSQVLLHRQLRLLDGMERRATEPEQLEDLFRIDHLTTRMRRHAEGLIILSGESPGRGWRQPVPLVDVLRAAVAEVEDYTRIRVAVRTKAALAGAAVADVIHLIAELAENATVFSPPNTPVRIFGDIVGRGFAVEIEDRGLGIPEDRLAEINVNLSNPPAFDLSGTDRLGLFIAGRLARRQDIKITLCPSPYGGITAIVIIPLNLVVDGDDRDRAPSIAGNGHALPLAGRHAALAEGPSVAGSNGLGSSDAPVGSSEAPADAPADASDALAGWADGLGDLPVGEAAGPADRAGLAAEGLDPLITTADLSGPDLPVRVRRRGLDTRREPPSPRPGARSPSGDLPAYFSDLPVSSGDLPARSSDLPVSSSDLPARSSDLPVSSSDLPARSSDLPVSSSDLPARSSDLPVSSGRQASPEAARTTMAALQRGWQRGRSDGGPTSAEAGPGGEDARDGAGS